MFPVGVEKRRKSSPKSKGLIRLCIRIFSKPVLLQTQDDISG